MPWTKITRAQYLRSGLRYASDMTDAEWRLIARELPGRHRLGRPREVDLRKVVGQFCSFCPPAANGELCHGSSRRIRRCRDIFMLGATLADGTGSSGLWFGRRGESSAASRHRRRPSSTARALRRHRLAARVASIRANGFMGASGTSLPIPTVSCWPSTSIPPTFRMSTVRSPCWSACEIAFPSCDTFLLTGFIGESSSLTHSPIAGRGPSKSSSARPGSKASSSCHGAGSLNVPSPGLEDADVSPETSRAQPQPRSRGFS